MRHPILAAAATLVLAQTIGGAAQAREVAPTAAPTAALATPGSWTGLPQFQWGESTLKFRGRALFDYVSQDVDRATGMDFSASESRLRTARLGVQGKVSDQWTYVAEASFGDGDVTWNDVVLTYAPNDHVEISFGNYRSLSLESMTSALHITFMERGAFSDLINTDRVMTLSARAGGDNWSVAGGVQGDSINDDSVVGDAQTGVFLRGHYAPVVTDALKIHLGAWVRERDRNDDTPFRYRVRNNTNYGDRYTDAGSSGLGAGNRDTTFGLEAASVWRSVSFQGEWAQVNADLTGGGKADARAYYVMASVFPTGEQRNYRAADGEFGRVRIHRPVNQGGPGAVELAVRYDNADLTDFTGVTTAGEYSAVTLGATWYPITYVRFMANYTRASNDARTAAADVDVETLQFRGQFDF